MDKDYTLIELRNYIDNNSNEFDRQANPEIAEEQTQLRYTRNNIKEPLSKQSKACKDLANYILTRCQKVRN